MPILRYVTVDARPSDPLTSVDASLFCDHLDAIVDCGYVPLSVANLITAITIDAPLPSRAIAITFDQGLHGFYDIALPALRERDIPSTVFVTTGFVGRESRGLAGSTSSERAAMTWSQLRDLRAEEVVIGSNGHSYRSLDVMGRWEAAEELALSRSLLEHQLERPITSVAYPSGLASPATQAAAARVGYRAACTLRGTVSSNYENIFALSRMAIDGHTRPEILIGHLEMAARRLPPTREALRAKVHRTVRRVGNIGGADGASARSVSTRAPRTGK